MEKIFSPSVDPSPIGSQTTKGAFAWSLQSMASKGLYNSIHAKRRRIKAGSGEKMRRPGSKGAPTAKAFKRSAKTAKNKK